MLQSWMRGQEPTLRDENLGESIQNVEELIRKHEDFQKTVENQEERFNLVRRLTEVRRDECFFRPAGSFLFYWLVGYLNKGVRHAQFFSVIYFGIGCVIEMILLMGRRDCGSFSIF
jgi:hypothetical protein